MATVDTVQGIHGSSRGFDHSEDLACFILMHICK
jgi:hypothetical protein